MKKKLKALLMIGIFVLIISLGIDFSTISSEAASYQYYSIAPGKTVQIGNYYFKVTKKTVYPYIIGYSSSKSGPYKDLPVETSFHSNGSYIYYMKDNHILYKYSLKTDKNYKLKSFSQTGLIAPSYYISAVYNGNIYITKGDIEQLRLFTYVYNLESGTYKRAKSDCSISFKKGAYCIARKEYRTDASPYSLSIYKFTDSGMTKIRLLTGFADKEILIDNYFYYFKYPSRTDLHRCALYKVRYSGSSAPVKVAYFTAPKANQIIKCVKITSTYCTYSVYSGTNVKTYKYTYATKKLTAIKN